jgi:hypothetical protein
MKKISKVKTLIIFLCGSFLCLAVLQCTKVGVLAKNLDRSATGDSTEFSPFYDVTKITPSDVTPDVNDSIVVKGVQSVIKEYCGISTCHGGPINPKLATYSDISSLVTPGNPEGSKLWNLITTNDLNKAMPPVNATHELSSTDKSVIYNWIRNGAKETPGLADFRPVAIRIISNGCTAGNCHSVLTSTGAWARAGLIPGLATGDTTTFFLNRAGVISTFCQLTNATLRNSVWNAYKDSVRKFYADTVANASYRPYKTFSSPVVKSSVRGSLSSYDDILLDIWYPKSARSAGSVQYTDGSGKKYYVKGNYLDVTSAIASRVDSTLLPANPFTTFPPAPTVVYATKHQGDMGYNDGGLGRSEIAIIKAWYFADPNIPDVWKYGNNNLGIFKYKKSGTIIKHQ